jgi:predicted negative regulator of RcsB-dependent stress response
LATTRPKITRKELKQPDEFQTILETAGAFLELHIIEVLFAAGALIVIAAIVFGIYYYQAHRARAAAARFDQAMTEFHDGKYEAAERDLASLAADEPHRAVGRLAYLYLGNAYLRQKQPAKARDALQHYLSEEKNPLFRGAALNDLAVTDEKLGDYKRAEEAYRQASDIEGPGQARAMLGMARMLQKQGKREDAIAVYRDFLARHPFAPERSIVMMSLAQMGASPDASQSALPVRPIKPAVAP